MRTSTNTKPRRVDFISDGADHACAFFGAIGMSTKFISKKTGLTASQISYRLKKGGFTRVNGASRLDYRNGDSPFSLSMVDIARKVIDDKKESKLIQFLNSQIT